jgi:hypothetical protein
VTRFIHLTSTTEEAHRSLLIIATTAAVNYLDIDDTVRSTFGYATQGAGYDYFGVTGLNVLLATVSSASAAPVIVATGLRKGSAHSARGAARLVATRSRPVDPAVSMGWWCCARTPPVRCRGHRCGPTFGECSRTAHPGVTPTTRPLRRPLHGRLWRAQVSPTA